MRATRPILRQFIELEQRQQTGKRCLMPIGQAEALVRAMRERGTKLEYMRADQGHSLTDPRIAAELNARMLRFLKTHLAQ